MGVGCSSAGGFSLLGGGMDVFGVCSVERSPVVEGVGVVDGEGIG